MIRIVELTKMFSGHRALDSITLDVTPGERVALVGQNGCGKTTLMRCLLGLYDFQGEVEVCGFSPRVDRESLLARIGFVPQSAPALRSTVNEYLRLTSELSGCDVSQIAENALSLGLHLRDCNDRAFKNLSGGMKQKLLIASAIARKPSVLIMDEPAANLDPIARARFFDLLAKLPSKTIMLLSSHRVDELSGLVTRFIEMDAGRVVLDDIVNATPSASLDHHLSCRIQLLSSPEPVVKSLNLWAFDRVNGDSNCWQGTIAAPDRFRFLAMVTRWSGMVSSLSIDEKAEGE